MTLQKYKKRRLLEIQIIGVMLRATKCQPIPVAFGQTFAVVQLCSGQFHIGQITMMSHYPSMNRTISMKIL